MIHMCGVAVMALGLAAGDAGGTGLVRSRAVHSTAFFDVVGRRAAAVGFEGRGFEVWVHPLQIAKDVQLSFRLAGYPLEVDGVTAATGIEVRPESTTFVYTHAAFTVRQTLFAPIDEPALVMRLEVRSVLPLTIYGSFRPRLKLMWPAGLMTQNIEWKEKENVYYLTEEAKKYVGILGGPLVEDLSVMPYQEEPRDTPVRFSIEPPKGATSYTTWVAFTGTIGSRKEAKAAYDRITAALPAAYDATIAHYRRVLDDRISIETPDSRLNEAFAWAKVGLDKGLATNPTLGTGFLAGFRTAGDSERPGFAWYFGRDALWSSFALSSIGDLRSMRDALDFLRKFQRADGKVPHEISQSAALIPWFTDYEYPWNATDASPLYVIAHADHWRFTGDNAYLKASWASILKAFRYAASTDANRNGLLDNTKFGHGWVEGGALYPPHEEFYLQGLWIEACRSMAELAQTMGDKALAAEARAAADKTREAAERIYWLPERGFYAFATMKPPEKPREAEPGPNRERVGRRMADLDKATIVDEDTVLPAVALWFGHSPDTRAQSQIDHLGAATLTTDWGQRLISNTSDLYDPISYHYGSVWPLFTGWTSMAAYRYGRPHIGQQAVMANARLDEPGALGFVTELLSGESMYPFGRSSHHQIWSEAMVMTPLLRGLFGLEVTEGGRVLRIAPQLPATWDRATLRRVPAGPGTVDVALHRSPDRYEIDVSPLHRFSEPRTSNLRGEESHLRLAVSPALPLDAQVQRVTSNGTSVPFEIEKRGDRQFVNATVELGASGTKVVFEGETGTDVQATFPELRNGDESQGIRILRSTASPDGLELVVEGRSGQRYDLALRTSRSPRAIDGTSIEAGGDDRYRLSIQFDGSDGVYERRTFTIPLWTDERKP